MINSKIRSEKVFTALSMEKYIPIFEEEEMEPEDFLLLSKEEQSHFIPKMGPRIRLIDYLLRECLEDPRVKNYKSLSKTKFEPINGKSEVDGKHCTGEREKARKTQIAKEALSHRIRRDLVYQSKHIKNEHASDDAKKQKKSILNGTTKTKLSVSPKPSPQTIESKPPQEADPTHPKKPIESNGHIPPAIAETTPPVKREDPPNKPSPQNGAPKPPKTTPSHSTPSSCILTPRYNPHDTIAYETDYSAPAIGDAEFNRIHEIYFAHLHPPKSESPHNVQSNPGPPLKRRPKPPAFFNAKVIFLNNLEKYGFLELESDGSGEPICSKQDVYFHESSLEDKRVQLAPGTLVKCSIRVIGGELFPSLRNRVLREGEEKLFKEFVEKFDRRIKAAEGQKTRTRLIAVALRSGNAAGGDAEGKERRTGRVICLKEDYGYINIGNGQQDVFFSVSDVAGSHEKRLGEDVKVSFLLSGKTHKGAPQMVATEVEVVPSAEKTRADKRGPRRFPARDIRVYN